MVGGSGRVKGGITSLLVSLFVLFEGQRRKLILSFLFVNAVIGDVKPEMKAVCAN